MRLTPKVALVIDALPGIGGAEKVLMDILELFPDAPIFTLMYNREAFARTPLVSHRVITSFIDCLPGARRHYRKYLPLMPRLVEGFDLQGYDLVISCSYAVAHGVRTQNGQRHVSYTHTPMRYAWNNLGLDGVVRPHNRLLNVMFAQFRKWDVAAARRVGEIAVISRWIAERVWHAYRREATLIYPPVAVERFSPLPGRGDYYITVNRLVAHKRVDLMVQAFNRLGLPLLVVGEGPERSRLERQARPNIRFLGYQPDEALAGLMGRARAFICAGNEDFGIAVVEAQAAGCPVIAYRMGGVLETVIEGQTGLFFDHPAAESLVEAVECFERERHNFHPDQITLSVQRFNKPRFLQEFAEFAGVH
ncbi:MAG: glycosyltransferase family 4 protein [Chloroflexota bacterium]|nr:MAG: glycosyltransferase family 4 protein [Chloroflexota bacterium]